MLDMNLSWSFYGEDIKIMSDINCILNVVRCIQTGDLSLMTKYNWNSRETSNDYLVVGPATWIIKSLSG